MSDLNVANDVVSDDEFEDTPELEDAEVIQDDAGVAQASNELVVAAKADVTQRSLRTLAQAFVSAAGMAGFQLYENGVHDWKVLAWAGAQAGVTVLVSYVHGKLFPAKP